MKYCIISDIDGTLALLQHRSPFDFSKSQHDLVNNPIANILEVYSHQKLFDIQIILMTGRNEEYRQITKEWLKKNDIKYHDLFMRKDGDFRKDLVVKKELYEKYIKGKYDILFVLEDRDQAVNMWRKEGLTCLQVAYGNF